ncbi:hypothetical protein M3B38_01945 [Dietzia cinnamea]|uniref:hypothetical protein n=1 Tax=Dietzia cinnamea TaxID=321318 RepID=UPI0021A34A10|nr:hypothetical protein [Dietzia cinnamea]MCT1710750.1 hypothetical protein [Dietzia cinnamea]
MKFFIDESVNLKMVRGLREVFQDHTFFYSGSDLPKSLDDVDIYPKAVELGCEVYICADIKQVRHPDRIHERQGCRDAGLHWVGITKVPVRGRRKVLVAEFAPLVAAFPYVLEDIAAAKAPQCFVLRPGLTDRQRIYDEQMPL